MATADKHDFPYQRSVQDPDTEVFFINRFFRALRKRAPFHVA